MSCVDSSVSARFYLSLVDHCGVRSCVRPVDAAHMAAGPPSRSIAAQCPAGQRMKSAYRVPIRGSSCYALTLPRGVPVAVPFDHHHSRLPSQSVAATVDCRSSYSLMPWLNSDTPPRASERPRQFARSCWPSLRWQAARVCAPAGIGPRRLSSWCWLQRVGSPR